jgi:hypothetical protein
MLLINLALLSFAFAQSVYLANVYNQLESVYLSATLVFPSAG